MGGGPVRAARASSATCGGWDEGYTFGGEDIDLCARVGRHYGVVYHPDVEITHYGRVSSRQHIGYAHTHTVVGITRFLRRNGTPPPALLVVQGRLHARRAAAVAAARGASTCGDAARPARKAAKSRLVMRRPGTS